MKIKEYFLLVVVPIIALLAIILRLSHTITSSSFGLIGLVLGLLGYIGSASSDTLKTEEQPITDLKEHFNPIKKRYNLVVGCVVIIGGFYLLILAFSFIGQF
ncbi:hypothetical protein ACQCN2_20070 [Brevibacillus ginsengisoli]|uniref:hypothetical protein n=1 Tax=Brevibacillus ginsengisoli TaxID=363854 RepID=UPI003CFA158B